MIFYKKLKKIQAITFDLDDTLYNNKPVILQANQSLKAWMEKAYPVTKTVDTLFWQTHLKNCLKDKPILKNDMGQLRLLSLLGGFKTLGLPDQAAKKAAQQSFEHFYFQRSRFTVNENIHSLLKILSGHFPLVAITNGNVNLEQIGIATYFTKCLQASVTLPMKPHSAMFDTAQQHLKIPQGNILHVGDNLQKDIWGALKAGYQAAWYAEDRDMSLGNERTISLPHIQLNQLEELLLLI